MIKQFAYRFLSRCFRALPLKKNTILFTSYYGAQYGCNPKYLSEYFAQRDPNWTIIWGFTTPEAHASVSASIVRYLSLRFLYELATCKVFVTNYRMPTFYHRRKGQIYIQTWHSSMRLKAIEEDAVESVSENYLKMAQNDSRQISFLLSGCERSTEIFRKAFWFNGEILSSGTPRMDLLFSKDKDLSMRIRTFLNLQEGEHVVLYAPTFREHIISDVGSLDLERLQLLLNKKWGGAWRILLRLHPHLKNQVSNYIGNKSFVLDVTCYDDVEELLYISDVIVSDYSSLIFDFLVTKRPCFLFTPDLKEYLEKERHLYYKLEDLPFPIIANNEAMERVLDSFDEYDYREKASAFLRHVGSYETGHACENVYRAIVNHLS